MLAAAAALHAEGITFAPGGPGAAGAAAGRLPGRRVVAWQRRYARLDGGGTEPPEDVPYVLVHLMARRRSPDQALPRRRVHADSTPHGAPPLAR
jgi:hypothetical protein